MNQKHFPLENIQVLIEVQSKNEEKNYLIEDTETKTKYLQKINSPFIESAQNPNLFISNMDKISKITKYPGLLPILNYTSSPNPSFIFEYKENGTLRDFITKNHGQTNFQQIFTNTKKYINLIGIAYAIQYLHCHNIFTHNIDSTTIYLDENLYPHIFILPIMNDKTDYFITWPRDVFTFACIAYEILTLQEASNSRSNLSLLNSEWQKQFIQKCWSKYDTQRPNIFDIIKELEGNKSEFGELNYEEIQQYEQNIQRYLSDYSKDVEKSATTIKDRDYYFICGNMLANGYGVTMNKHKAIKCYKMSADGGHLSSMLNYGLMIENFPGILSKKKEAFRYYKAASEQGHCTSMFNYALMLYNGEQGIPINKQESARLFKISADLGNANSMFNIAFMLEQGEGIEVNKKEAVKYYKLAADHGNIIAMNSYASMLKKGDGIKKNKKKAACYFKKAADLGDSSAMFNYAFMLKTGNGIIQNHHEAFKYFKLASDKGNDSALFNLALMLYSGDGTEVNKIEAASYFKKSADIGNADAMFNYALMLKNGDGIEKNIKEAIRYFKMASDKGNINAQNQYSKLTQFIRASI